MFYSEHVIVKKISVKLPKIKGHTFRNTTYSKATRLHLTMQLLSIILLASKIADSD